MSSMKIMNGGTYLTLCDAITFALRESEGKETLLLTTRPASDEDSFECFHWLFGTHTRCSLAMAGEALLIYEDSSRPPLSLS